MSLKQAVVSWVLRTLVIYFCLRVHQNAQSIPARQGKAMQGKVLFVQLSVLPTMVQSKLGDKDKWNGRELVSFGEDLGGEGTAVVERRVAGGKGIATSTRRSPCIV
jgi:hypothetical protein